MQGIWHQLKTYKNLVLSLWFLNIACLAGAAILGYSYFQTAEKEIKVLQVELKNNTETMSLVASLSEKSNKNKIFQINTELYNSVPAYRESVPFSRQKLLDKKNDVLVSIAESMNTKAKDLARLTDDIQGQRSEALALGVMALLFGLILPTIIIRLMLKLGWFAKTKAEDKLKEFLSSWAKEQAKHKEPFKSPDFWLKIGLLSAHHISEQWNHPSARYVHDISIEVYAELARETFDSNSEPESSDNKTSSEAA